MRGEHLRFAQARGARADRTGFDETAGHLRALVRLAMGAEGLAAIAQVAGHPCDVGLEPIEIEQEGGGGDVVARAHRSGSS